MLTVLMNHSDGNIAAIAFLMTLLFVSVAFHIMRSASPNSYLVQEHNQYDKGSRKYCDAKLRGLDYDASTDSRPRENGNKQEERDNLCQQMRSAEAAEESAGYAAGQMWSSLAGLAVVFVATFFAYRAYGETRRQADAAWEAVRQATISAEAAVSAARTASQSAERELRSMLAVTNVKVNAVPLAEDIKVWSPTSMREDKGTTYFTLWIDNIGKLPAQDAGIEVNVLVFRKADRSATVSTTETLRIAVIMPKIGAADAPDRPFRLTSAGVARSARNRFGSVDGLIVRCNIVIMYNDDFTIERGDLRPRRLHVTYEGAFDEESELRPIPISGAVR